MNAIEYRVMRESDIEKVLEFWKNIDGIHMHSNGEETAQAINTYLQRNPGLSFVAEEQGKLVGAVCFVQQHRRSGIL